MKWAVVVSLVVVLLVGATGPAMAAAADASAPSGQSEQQPKISNRLPAQWSWIPGDQWGIYIPTELVRQLGSIVLYWDEARQQVVILPAGPGWWYPIYDLKFSLWFSYSGWGTPERRLVFTIKNPTSQDVTMVYDSARTFDIVIEKDGKEVWRHSENVRYPGGFYVDVLPAGATRTHFIKMPSNLSRGWYTVKAYYGPWRQLVATTAFYQS